LEVEKVELGNPAVLPTEEYGTYLTQHIDITLNMSVGGNKESTRIALH